MVTFKVQFNEFSGEIMTKLFFFRSFNKYEFEN